jgi:hypothetical protein
MIRIAGAWGWRRVRNVVRVEAEEDKTGTADGRGETGAR